MGRTAGGFLLGSLRDERRELALVVPKLLLGPHTPRVLAVRKATAWRGPGGSGAGGGRPGARCPLRAALSGSRGGPVVVEGGPAAAAMRWLRGFVHTQRTNGGGGEGQENVEGDGGARGRVRRGWRSGAARPCGAPVRAPDPRLRHAGTLMDAPSPTPGAPPATDRPPVDPAVVSDSVVGRRASAWPLLIALLCTVAGVGPMVGGSFALWDVGELHFYATRWVSGEVPGRDFVVNAYGPLPYVVVGLLWRLTGPSLLHLDLLFFAGRLLLAAGTYALGRRLRLGSFAILAPLLLAVAPGPLHKTPYLLALLATTALLLVRAHRQWSVAAVGWGFAGIATVRPDLAAFGIGAAWVLGRIGDDTEARDSLGRGLAAERTGIGGPKGAWFADLLHLGGPSCGVAALALLGLVAADRSAPAAVWAQVRHDARMNQVVPEPGWPGVESLLRPTNADPFLLYLPLAVVGTWLWLVRRGVALPWQRREGLTLGLALLIACNQIRMKPDLSHLLQMGPVLWLVVAGLVQGSGRGGSLLGGLLTVVLAVQGPVFHPGDPYAGAVSLGWTRTEVVATALGPIRLQPSERQWVEPLLRWLADGSPPGPVWVPTYQPLLPALAGRALAGRSPGLLYLADDDGAQEALLDSFAADPPAVVLFIDDSPEGEARRFHRAAPRLHEHMERHWRTSRRFGPVDARVPRIGGSEAGPGRRGAGENGDLESTGHAPPD